MEDQPDRFVVGLPLGRWRANCWVIGDRSRGSAVVVDPGEGAEREVPRVLERTGTSCAAILLTHGHLDHLWGTPSLARELDVPVLLHPDDRWLWDDPAAAFGAPPSLLSTELGVEWDPPTERLRDLADGERLSFAGLDLRVRHTPGHTPGHVVFVGDGLARTPLTFAIGEADSLPDTVLFSGDLLFAGSIGRTDFPRGSTEAIMRSLADTVLPLEDGTLVLSGHGPDTTVGTERATNPFLLRVASG